MHHILSALAHNLNANRDLIRGVYGGVRLMYGRKSGYGGYGPPPGWLRGARVIEIHENPFKVQMSLLLLLDCTLGRERG
jgi:hypothetical protein